MGQVIDCEKISTYISLFKINSCVVKDLNSLLTKVKEMFIVEKVLIQTLKLHMYMSEFWPITINEN